MEQKELVEQLNHTEKRQILVHYLVIVLLATVLFSLIAGYIYYGMERAKIGDDPQVDETPAVPSDTELTPEDRQAILDSLATKEVEENPLTPEDRQAILDSLEESAVDATGEAPAPELTPEDRRAILESL